MAVGMFGMEWLGSRLAAAHYLGALVVGLIFRFYAAGTPATPPAAVREGNILARAVAALLAARREDGRGLGQILGDAVTDSIKTLFMICGFIMLFSTFVRMIEVVRLGEWVAAPFRLAFALLGLSPSLIPAAVAGLLEIDLGTVAASQSAAPLVEKALMASAIIAWSGLSVHGQVASVLTGTDIRMGPYAAARLLHAVLAAIFTVPLVRWALSDQPAVAVFGPLPAAPGFWPHLLHAARWAVAVPMALVAVGAGAALVSGGLRWAWFYHRR